MGAFIWVSDFDFVGSNPYEFLDVIAYVDDINTKVEAKSGLAQEMNGPTGTQLGKLSEMAFYKSAKVRFLGKQLGRNLSEAPFPLSLVKVLSLD